MRCAGGVECRYQWFQRGRAQTQDKRNEQRGHRLRQGALNDGCQRCAKTVKRPNDWIASRLADGQAWKVHAGEDRGDPMRWRCQEISLQFHGVAVMRAVGVIDNAAEHQCFQLSMRVLPGYAVVCAHAVYRDGEQVAVRLQLRFIDDAAHHLKLLRTDPCADSGVISNR